MFLFSVEKGAPSVLYRDIYFKSADMRSAQASKTKCTPLPKKLRTSSILPRSSFAKVGQPKLCEDTDFSRSLVLKIPKYPGNEVKRSNMAAVTTILNKLSCHLLQLL